MQRFALSVEVLRGRLNTCMNKRVKTHFFKCKLIFLSLDAYPLSPPRLTSLPSKTSSVLCSVWSDRCWIWMEWPPPLPHAGHQFWLHCSTTLIAVDLRNQKTVWERYSSYLPCWRIQSHPRNPCLSPSIALGISWLVRKYSSPSFFPFPISIFLILPTTAYLNEANAYLAPVICRLLCVGLKTPGWMRYTPVFPCSHYSSSHWLPWSQARA